MSFFLALFLQYWPYTSRIAAVTRHAVTIMSDMKTS